MTANTTANAEMVAGASPHDEVNWQTIDWSKVHQEVRRLQARIVQATKEGRWGKVKNIYSLRKPRPSRGV